MHPFASEIIYEHERTFPAHKKEEAIAFAEQLADGGKSEVIDTLIIEASPYDRPPDEILPQMEGLIQERKTLWAKARKQSTEKDVS